MFYTYDPKEVTLTVNNATILGFADGSYINHSKDSDTYREHVGAQGEFTRTKDSNPMGQITVTLKATSPSNAYLSNLAQSDNYFPVSLFDGNVGQTMVSGNRAFVQKPADGSKGEEEGSREWIIRIADYLHDEKHNSAS